MHVGPWGWSTLRSEPPQLARLRQPTTSRCLSWPVHAVCHLAPDRISVGTRGHRRRLTSVMSAHHRSTVPTSTAADPLPSRICVCMMRPRRTVSQSLPLGRSPTPRRSDPGWNAPRTVAKEVLCDTSREGGPEPHRRAISEDPELAGATPAKGRRGAVPGGDPRSAALTARRSARAPRQPPRGLPPEGSDRSLAER
jgi:hypothetical protein